MNLCSQNTMRPLSWAGFWLPVLCSLQEAAAGESQMIGPPHSVVALAGDDVILPCHLIPEMDVTKEPLEWTRSDLNLKRVHVMRDGRSLDYEQNPSYRGRTSLFTEGMKRGNISMKLSNVQLSDRGTYKCDIPLRKKESSVQLVVFAEAVSSTATVTAWMDRGGGGVVLRCESGGWYPEPELLWLDAEGNLLSAGPPETARGPDDLYTVSSRVTVEKRHSNSFTCRVHQKTTNQTRDTHITVPEDLFKHPDSSIITGLAVSLAVCILLLLLLLFFVWRWRRNIIKNKRTHSEEREREKLMADRTVETKDTELQNLKEEKKKNETELQNLKEEKDMFIHLLLDYQLGDEQKIREQVDKVMKQLMNKNIEVSSLSAQQEDSSSANQNSATGSVFVIEVNDQGQYIRLRNTSDQEQQLGGWRLEMKVNRKNILFLFEKSLKLKSGDAVTMSGSGWGIRYLTSDLWWNDFKPFSPADELKFILINNHTDIQHELRSYLVNN